MRIFGSFKGRIGRLAFIVGFLLSKAFVGVVLFLVWYGIDYLEPGTSLGTTSLYASGFRKTAGLILDASFGVCLIIWVFTEAALIVKRLHDSDDSGWGWLLVCGVAAVLPILYFISLPVLALRLGDDGDNRFGPTRKNWFAVSSHDQHWNPPLPSRPQGSPLA